MIVPVRGIAQIAGLVAVLGFGFAVQGLAAPPPWSNSGRREAPVPPPLTPAPRAPGPAAPSAAPARKVPAIATQQRTPHEVDDRIGVEEVFHRLISRVWFILAL